MVWKFSGPWGLLASTLMQSVYLPTCFRLVGQHYQIAESDKTLENPITCFTKEKAFQFDSLIGFTSQKASHQRWQLITEQIESLLVKKFSFLEG